MIAFEVYLNGRKLTVAGADDLTVLTAIVGAGGVLGKTTARTQQSNRTHLDLNVGGLTGRPDGLEDEHLRWIEFKPRHSGTYAVTVNATDLAGNAGDATGSVEVKRKK